MDEVYLSSAFPSQEGCTDETATSSELKKRAVSMLEASSDATRPEPRSFVEQGEGELGPERVWSPNFIGCQSEFVDQRCPFFSPAERIYSTDLNELQLRRSLLAGQDGLPEPLSTRQAWVQFLAMDVRPGAKDPYTRATLSNDLLANTCNLIRRKGEPRFVSF